MGVKGLGLRVLGFWGLGFMIERFGSFRTFGVMGLELWMEGFGVYDRGLGFRIKGFAVQG